MPNINITLPEELNLLIEEEQKKINISKADLLIRILKKYFQDKEV